MVEVSDAPYVGKWIPGRRLLRSLGLFTPYLVSSRDESLLTTAPADATSLAAVATEGFNVRVSVGTCRASDITIDKITGRKDTL